MILFRVINRGIDEVRYSFLRIFAPTLYSAVFLLYAPTPALIKIGFDVVQCGVGAVLRFGLDSFGPDLVNPNINFNLKKSIFTATQKFD